MMNKKLQVWFPLIVALVLIIGMMLGYQMGAGKSGKGFFASNKTSKLQDALEIIKMKYVDSVHIDSLQGQAIQDIMSELDPHSVYLPPADLKAANEDLAGNFDGIGIEFNIYNDTVAVVYVIPGGPGDKAGMQAGDQVIKANDSVISGKKLSSNDISRFIRGAKGSKVSLQLLRNGKPLQLSATRATIPVPSVEAAYMLDKTNAYLKLNKFTETSYEEFMSAMEDLKKKGMQNLVLDLRHNGGGLMDEAVDIADEFLDGDKLIVYTQGVNSTKREYHCKRPGLMEKGEVVLLVDELTASASEVLTGALQDWCRARVVGRRTFGKGLVMEQFPLGDGSALRLTTARYYTPIGRCIQRSYDKGKKIYMDEVWDRYSDGEIFNADSGKIVHGKAYLTICKDTVYGGEGIMPGIFVSADTNLYTPRINDLLTSNKLNVFAFNYYLQHRSELDAYPNAADFASGFNADNMLAAFIKETPSLATLSSAGKEIIRQRLKAMLSRFRWRGAGYYQVLNASDREIIRALELLKK